MRKVYLIIIFIFLLIMILFGINFYIRQGSLKIIFIDNAPIKVIINDEVIIGINNNYFIKTDYGPVCIKIYYEHEQNPTVLNIFKENNWYKSKMEIYLSNNILYIKYIEDFSKINDIENINVEIGGEITFSWL